MNFTFFVIFVLIAKIIFLWRLVRRRSIVIGIRVVRCTSLSYAQFLEFGQEAESVVANGYCLGGCVYRLS